MVTIVEQRFGVYSKLSLYSRISSIVSVGTCRRPTGIRVL